MNPEKILASLRDSLALNDRQRLAALLDEYHPADLAAALADVEPGEILGYLRRMPGRERAELFGYFEPEVQTSVIEIAGRAELAELFQHLSPDERVDIFNRLPTASAEALLPALAQAEREDIRKLASYEEGTVGAVMTSDYATLLPELTAREAVEYLRAQAPNTETIYQAYVVDEERRLIGTVSLRDLIVAAPNAHVSDLMFEEVIFVRATDPVVTAAETVAKYDLLAVPVVNGGDTLVGIVTYDDAMDVAEEAATEDFHKAGGSSGPMGVSLKEASVGLLYRKRIFWLVILVFGNLFSSAGLAYFEDTIATHVALVFFLPLLIGSGGNAGSQSATLMVRAMATGDVTASDWAWLLGRELIVAALLGLTMAFAVFGVGVARAGPEITGVVVCTMLLVVIVGSLIGMSLPFLLSLFRLDPAAASAPLVTTIADAMGVLIYFGLATTILPRAVG